MLYAYRYESGYSAKIRLQLQSPRNISSDCDFWLASDLIILQICSSATVDHIISAVLLGSYFSPVTRSFEL